MVTGLRDFRIEVADLLGAAGITSQEYIEEVIQPPVAVVIPGDPYISPGDTFNAYVVNLQILLIGARGTNATTSAVVDELIETVLTALTGWDITDVAQPGLVNLNGGSYLGTVIYLKTQIQFTEGAG